MSASRYEQILGDIEALSTEEQLRLLESLAGHVRLQARAGARRSVLELKGLGREIWDGIDAQEYVNKESESWIG